jgi:hypothetical protein
MCTFPQADFVGTMGDSDFPAHCGKVNSRFAVFIFLGYQSEKWQYQQAISHAFFPNHSHGDMPDGSSKIDRHRKPKGEEA